MLDRIVYQKGSMSKVQDAVKYKEHRYFLKLLKNHDAIPCAFYKRKKSVTDDLGRRSLQAGRESTGNMTKRRDFQTSEISVLEEQKQASASPYDDSDVKIDDNEDNNTSS